MKEGFSDALKYAINSGNIPLFDLLMKDFEEINKNDELEEKDKNFILQQTVVNAPDVKFIQHVIDYGYDINIKDEEGNTLLHYAAVSSNPETVQFFIDKGLDKEAKNIWDGTPLCLAAKECTEVKVLKTLIDNGCDINATCHGGETLLITAAGLNPNPEIITFLISQGLDIEGQDNEGMTPLLQAAAYQENTDVFKVLLDAGADMRATTNEGDNMFHMVAYNPCANVARYVSAGFMTSEVNDAGESCFEKMLTNGKSGESARFFLRKMKEEHLFRAANNENPEILETLIQSGYDINTNDSDGMTPLMMAAKFNTNPNIIKMMMYYRVDIFAKDEKGRNALHYAASNTDPTIYDWMVENESFKEIVDEFDVFLNKAEHYRKHPDEFA